MKMIGSGLSYGAVAERLGVTRGSVAGRIFRLKNRMSVKKEPRTVRGVSHADQVAAANRLRAKSFKKKVTKEAAMKKVAEPPRVKEADDKRLKPLAPGVLPMVDNPKTLLELGPRECKAPVGPGPATIHGGVLNPFLFCGAKTEDGEIYCADHRPIMFIKKTGVAKPVALPKIGLTKDW